LCFGRQHLQVVADALAVAEGREVIGILRGGKTLALLGPLLIDTPERSQLVYDLAQPVGHGLVVLLDRDVIFGITRREVSAPLAAIEEGQADRRAHADFAVAGRHEAPGSQDLETRKRCQIHVRIELRFRVVYAVLRGFNIYGETLPWVQGADFVHTLMSWVNFTKYPPSLDFLLLTLGIAFLLLAGFESRDNRAARALAIFGGAPMFFYLLHLYTLLVLYRVALALFGPNHGDRFGVDHVWWIWVAAASLACALYFPCRAFTQFKRRSSQAWVRYF